MNGSGLNNKLLESLDTTKGGRYGDGLRGSYNLVVNGINHPQNHMNTLTNKAYAALQELHRAMDNTSNYI